MSKASKAKGMLETGVNLKRTRRERTVTDIADTETSIDVVSMADRSETNLQRHMMAGIKCENTYKLEPDVHFSACEVEKLTEHILAERLNDIKYDPSTCKVLSQELAGHIMERMKAFNFKRYKMVAVVSLGSIKERPGLQFGSRCLWNQNTDSFASVKYTNGSIFAVAMIYGLYYE